jgi:hypothetical protein
VEEIVRPSDVGSCGADDHVIPRIETFCSACYNRYFTLGNKHKII